MKEQLLVASKKLWKSVSATANAECVASELQIKFHAWKMKSEGLSTVLQDAKKASADQVSMVKTKTDLDFADTTEPRLLDELCSLCDDF